MVTPRPEIAALLGNGHSSPRINGTPKERRHGGTINSTLPTELILKVFSYLDVISLCRSAQVCRLWSKLALDGENWKEVQLWEFGRDVTPAVLERLSLRCGGFLRSLNLTGCHQITDDVIRVFSENCNHIDDLNLEQCKQLTDNACASLTKNCKRLRCLNLSSCMGVTTQSLVYLARALHLEFLNVRWCDLSDSGLIALAAGCSQLRTLLCAGADHLTNDALVAIAEHCGELEHVDLSKCTRFSDQGIAALAVGCPRLRHLSLTCCKQLTDVSLVAIGNACHELRIFEIAHCAHFTDAGMSALAKGCPALERLDVEECVQLTDLSLLSISEHCHSIQKLSLSHCQLITDEGIRHLTFSTDLGILAIDNCSQVSDSALDYLSHLNSLQQVHVFDCQLITRSAIRKLLLRQPNCKVRAYFAPATPPRDAATRPRRYCRCCAIL